MGGGLVRALLLGLLVLAGTSPAWATGPITYPPGSGGGATGPTGPTGADGAAGAAGATGPTGATGASTFSAIAGSTNTTAAMVVGTGASLTTSGSGSITATDVVCASSPCVANSETTATSANTNSAIVARDGSGNFSAGTITASLTGDASLDAKLLGRSGGQTVNGSTLTAESLILQANAADHTTGSITLNAPTVILDSSYTNTTASNDILSFTPTATLSGGPPTLNGYNFSPALTLSSATDGVNALKVGGSWSVSSTSPLVRGLLFAPTIDYSNTTDPFPVYQVNGATCAPSFTSSTANGTLYQDCFVDGTTITYSGATDLDNNASTGNPWAPISVLINGTTQTSGAGDLTIGKIVGMQYQGMFDTGNAASLLTVSDLDLVRSAVPSCTAANCGPGSVAITSFSLANGNFTSALDTALTIGTAYGLRLQSWDKASTNITLFSDATGATMRHAGSARFGATGAPSAGYSVDSAGAVQIGTAGGVIADVASGTTSFISATDSVDMTGGVLAGFDFEPTSTLSGGAATPSIAAVRFVPTVSESALIPNIFGLTMGGTSTATAGTLQTSVGVSNTMTYTSATASVNPINSLTGLTNNSTISQTAASGSVTVGSNIGMQHSPIIIENSSGGATGSMTLTSDTGVNMAGTYTQTAGTLAVTTRTGLKFNNPTDASNVLVNNVGVDCAALTKGTTERSCIRSAVAANAAAFFLHDTGGAQSSLAGKFTTYNGVATAGLGMPTIYGESGVSATKSANFTALTYTPPATAGRYRASAVITSTSATNTGTFQCTLDYVDSQGTTHTADILPMHGAAGTVAASQTDVASKEFHCGTPEFSINNAATAIVVKVVITGTVAYTVAATVEQIA